MIGSRITSPRPPMLSILLLSHGSITSEDPDEIGRERLAKMIAHYRIDPEGVPFEYVYMQGCIAEIDETGKVKPAPSNTILPSSYSLLQAA